MPVGLSCQYAPGVVKMIVAAVEDQSDSPFMRQEVNLTPEQARHHAKLLIEAADRSEAAQTPASEPPPEGSAE